MARPLQFPELVSLLIHEHAGIRRNLGALGDALVREQYAEAVGLAADFRGSLRQHIIDEEARILKVLIDAHGRSGADEAIRTFQQHRTVHQLVGEIEKLALTAPEKLAGKYEELANLLQRHFELEERRIFPWALETGEGTLGKARA